MRKKTAIARVKIDSDLNIFTAEALRDRLLKSLGQAATLDLDLSAVGEVDSAGLQVLIATKREATLLNKPLRLVAVSASVTELLNLCGLAAYFSESAQAAE